MLTGLSLYLVHYINTCNLNINDIKIWKSYSSSQVNIKNKNRYRFPRIIWFYWNSLPLNKMIKMITDHWKLIMTGWKIIQLTDENLSFYDIDIPEYFKRESVQHKSDWIRLCILEKRGGFWIDASIIIHSGDAIESIRNDAIRDNVDMIGFYSENQMKSLDDNVFENWFIGAPIGSTFIKDWKREFEYAHQIGPYKYKKQLIHDKINLQDIFKHEYDVYLLMHACYMKLINDIDKNKDKPYKIMAYRAEDTMFLPHKKSYFIPFIRAHMATRLDSINIPFIKLTKWDREFVSINRLKRVLDKSYKHYMKSNDI